MTDVLLRVTRIRVPGLQGPPGPDGADGADGAQGPRGPSGDVTPEAQAILDAALVAQTASETAAANAETSRAAAVVAETAAETSEAGAAISANNANTDALSAAFSALQALTASPIYPDVATGRAAVADGATFTVVGADANTYATLYRRTSSSTQDTLGSYISKAGLERLIDVTAARLWTGPDVRPFVVESPNGRAYIASNIDGTTWLRLDDNAIAWIFAHAESVAATYASVTLPPATSRDWDPQRPAGWIGLIDGTAAWVVFNRDMTVDFRLSSTGLTRLIDQIDGAGFRLGEPLRGSWGTVLDLTHATIIAVDPVTAVETPLDVVQLRTGTHTTAVEDTDQPISFTAVAGQSNAGPQLLLPGVVGPVYPQQCFDYPTGPFDGGDNLLRVDPDDLNDLVALSDSATQKLASTYAWALEYKRGVAGDPSGGVLACTAWDPGDPLTSFIQDSANWDNLIAMANASFGVAHSYGRSVALAPTLFVQGESGPNTGYAAMFDTYITDLRAALADIFGVTAAEVPFYFAIVSNAPVARDQYTVGKARLGTGVVMASSFYQFGLVDSAHAPATGRMMFGDTMADAVWLAETTGVDFVPLMPTSIVRSGAGIDITFSGPVGTMSFDADWVAASNKQGFAFVDDSTSAVVSTVTITGARTVRVTLNTTPTGANKKLRYATGGAGVASGWTTLRGNLMIETTRESLFYLLGETVPHYTRHYCLPFEEAVT